MWCIREKVILMDWSSRSSKRSGYYDLGGNLLESSWQGVHKWDIPSFLVQTIPMNLWKQKSCAPEGFSIPWFSFPLHKKKLFISHLCNRRHTSQIRISETFFIELARIRSILLQYKEYMGQALYQERGAMPVRSFCLSGGQYPEKTAHILKKVFLLHRPLVIDMKMFYY